MSHRGRLCFELLGQDGFRVLLQLQEYGPHPGRVLGVPTGLLVEVAQLVNAVPLGTGLDVVHLGHVGLFVLSIVVLGLVELLVIFFVPERLENVILKEIGSPCKASFLLLTYQSANSFLA